MFHVSRLRRAIVLAAVIVWAAFSAHAKEEAKGELERLYDEFNQITLDTSKGFAVKDFLLEHDSFSATLEDGVLFFSNKIGDQLYAAVFLGRGKMTIDIPEPVKAMQFRNILWVRESKDPSKKGIKDQPFAQAFLVVPTDIQSPINYELLSGKYKVPGSEVTVATEGELPEKSRERAQELFAQQAGPPDWREIPVRSVVWRHLNNFPNEHFEFRANTEDFEWVRYRFNPDFERECHAGRISYKAAYGRQQVIYKGRVHWDRRKDYRQDKGGWTANLRKRLHEDRRTIEIFHYDMDITIEKAASRLENKMTMRIRPRREGVRCAWFDFFSHKNIKFRLKGYSWHDELRKTFIIKKCTDAEGNSLDFFHDRNKLLVDLGKPMEMENDYTIDLEYEAKFIMALSYTYLLSSDYPWCPQVGTMENEATYDVKVRVPSRSIASGHTVKRWEEAGYACLHTRIDKPVSVFAIVFGEYQWRFGKLYDVEENAEMEELAEKWGNPTIYVYGFDDLPRRLAQARSSLQFYNWFFQTPFPYDELDIVPTFGMNLHNFIWTSVPRSQKDSEPDVIPTFGTNLHTSGLVQMGDFTYHPSHQLAHQWWPEITGLRNNTQDAWLSEGFAEYTAGLRLEFFEEQEEEGTGFKALCEKAENEWLIGPARGFLQWFRYAGVLNLKPHKQASLYSPGASYEPSPSFLSSYSVQVSQKGPYVLHMLRSIVGPELFRTLLQRFLKDFAGKQPVTPDFIDTVRAVIGEYVTGETFRAYRESKTPVAEWPREIRNQFLLLGDFYKNLDDWFEDWYIDPGHAKIRFSWSVRKDAEKGGYVFTGRIRQDPEEFKMVLAPIILRFTEGSTFVQRFVDKNDYTFQLRLPGELTEVVFDEFKTLAAEVTVEEE